MKQITLTKDQIAIVDDEDFIYLSKYKWYAVKNRNTHYAKRKENKKHIPMHRQILKLSDKHILVDHIDGNGLNNQKHNLRKCSNAENICNRKKQKNTTSKYMGIYKEGNRWRAALKKNGIIHRLGYFADEKSAAMAYNMAAIKFHGEYARLNIL